MVDDGTGDGGVGVAVIVTGLAVVADVARCFCS